MAGGAARPVWVFGAGPVGTALVPSLAALGFAVTWVDARRASFPAALPRNVDDAGSPPTPAGSSATFPRAPSSSS